MAESATLEKLRQRRLDKMRLGQAACEISSLLSDPGVRVALVPLLEGEYLRVLQATAIKDFPENNAGEVARDEWQRVEILAIALREVENLEIRIFQSADQVHDNLEVSDINHLMDLWLEMVSQQSPSAEAIPEEEFNEIKKVLNSINMSALSGRQWYALTRYLRSILPDLPRVSSYGSSSISNSTLMNESETFTLDVLENGDNDDAKFVASPLESQE